MRTAAVAFIACLAAGSSAAQTPREAISPSLSPEDAAAAFKETVETACIPAAVSGGVGSLASSVRSGLRASSDAETRRQVGAAADDAVWNVASAMGVVMVHERPGRCVVTVYGPPAMSTILSLSQTLSGDPWNFERLVTTPAVDEFSQSLLRNENGKRVIVMLKGAEPGMAGNRSRFSVVTATVSATPAN